MPGEDAQRMTDGLNGIVQHNDWQGIYIADRRVLSLGPQKQTLRQ